MSQFLLFLLDPTTDDSTMSPEQIQAIINEYHAWSQKMGEAGKLVGGEKLKNDGGKILTGWESELSITDGPLAEVKEVIGGFFLVEASDYEEALALSMDCPHLKFGGTIEVREVDKVS